MLKSALGIGTLFDRAFVRLAFKRRGKKRWVASSAILERIDTAAVLYETADREGRLFPAPSQPTFKTRLVGQLSGGGQITDLCWNSGYAPIHPSYEKTLRHCIENGLCHARWFRHKRQRPTMICLHGWGAGQFPVEEHAYQVRWFYKLGLDVVLMTLPFHAQRALTGRRTPLFPSTDPVRTNEGFAQAVSDIRALMAGLTALGSKQLGITGMSLGGFTAALLATVESELAFVVPFVPFASIPGLLWGHGSGTPARKRAEHAGVTLKRFEAAFAATTPILREPTIDPTRMLILAGKRDLVTPMSESRKLHAHFVGSTFESFPGSHLMQWGRGRAFKTMARFLSELGVLSPKS